MRRYRMIAIPSTMFTLPSPLTSAASRQTGVGPPWKRKFRIQIPSAMLTMPSSLESARSKALATCSITVTTPPAVVGVADPVGDLVLFTMLLYGGLVFPIAAAQVYLHGKRNRKAAENA